MKNKVMPREKPENTRICEECNERTTINPHNRFCATCLGARPKGKQAKQPEKKPAPSRRSSDMGNKEKPSHASDTALTIDFGRHAEVLEQVEDLAEKETRPLEYQVLHMLKYYIEQHAGGVKGP